MANLEFYQFPCLSDNYGVLVHDADSGNTASIDAPDADAVLQAAKTKGWSLTHIFTTHHHPDHTDGNLPLKEQGDLTIYGPKAEASKVPGIDHALGDGDTFDFCGHEVNVLDTPGHTSGHIAYWIPSAKVAFVGDTLFALGCGRVFEGTPEQMWSSLQKIMALPDDTTLYCGHEYTLSNATFALSLDPNNSALQDRAQQIEALRADGLATLPTLLATEKATNPFLRPDDSGIRETLGMQDASDVAVFTEIRERKNNA